ncbi:MAG: nicotinate-nucleotide adenylyltransferase [Luteitalea sp.]|nr:nicotinate-nucleotide adenylyltransferase [Luteitalea sp.]
MLLGILGGTLDPIHCGHLDAAEAARTRLGLQEVWMMPARVPPLRADPPVASAAHRFAMAALAVNGRAHLRASDLELRREGPSYTWDTLQQLYTLGYNRSQIFFITGVDAILKIATWYRYPALLEACHFVAVTRPGVSAGTLAEALPEAADRVVAASLTSNRETRVVAERCRIWLVDAPTAAVSSTDVRHLAARGEPLDGLVPSLVATHIRQHNLYRSTPDPAGDLHDQD